MSERMRPRLCKVAATNKTMSGWICLFVLRGGHAHDVTVPPNAGQGAREPSIYAASHLARGLVVFAAGVVSAAPPPASTHMHCARGRRRLAAPPMDRHVPSLPTLPNATLAQESLESLVNCSTAPVLPEGPSLVRSGVQGRGP